MIAHKKWHTAPPSYLAPQTVSSPPESLSLPPYIKFTLRSRQTTQHLRRGDLTSGAPDPKDSSNILSGYKGNVLSDPWDLSVTWYSLCG